MRKQLISFAKVIGVFVKYQSQGGVTPKHFVRPCHCQPGVD